MSFLRLAFPRALRSRSPSSSSSRSSCLPARECSDEDPADAISHLRTDPVRTRPLDGCPWHCDSVSPDCCKGSADQLSSLRWPRICPQLHHGPNGVRELRSCHFHGHRGLCARGRNRSPRFPSLARRDPGGGTRSCVRVRDRHGDTQVPRRIFCNHDPRPVPRGKEHRPRDLRARRGRGNLHEPRVPTARPVLYDLGDRRPRNQPHILGDARASRVWAAVHHERRRCGEDGGCQRVAIDAEPVRHQRHVYRRYGCRLRVDPFRCPTGYGIRHHLFTSDARHDHHRRGWDVTRSVPRCDHCLCPIQLLPNGSEPARTPARGHRCPRPTHRPLHSHRHRGHPPPLCPLSPEVHRVSARLVAREVRKDFGGVQALRGVSLTMEEGSVVGLIGPNGSGKTTLLNLLAGAEKPTSGTIELNGRRIDGLPLNRVVGLGIAKTYQIPRPFLAMTVRENVAVAAMYGAFHRKPGEARDDAGRLLSLVEMDRQAETVAAELTVQHRKQLELARAIATGARILLLDEVFAGLSSDELPRSINLVSKIQKELGFGALVVEHVMRAVLTLSNHVVVIEEGRTIAEGAPQEVVHDPAVIEAYLGTEVARAPT